MGAAVSRSRRRLIAEDPEFAAALSRRAVALGKAAAGRSGFKFAPDVVEARNRKRVAKTHGWLPDEYRDLYHSLRKVKGLRAAEARQLVEEKIALDAERVARLDPLERQLLAVRRGAGLIIDGHMRLQGADDATCAISRRVKR